MSVKHQMQVVALSIVGRVRVAKPNIERGCKEQSLQKAENIYNAKGKGSRLSHAVSKTLEESALPVVRLRIRGHRVALVPVRRAEFCKIVAMRKHNFANAKVTPLPVKAVASCRLLSPV